MSAIQQPTPTDWANTHPDTLRTFSAAGLEPTDVDPQETASGTVRVLYVINGEHYAGAERVQDLLAQRLGELGFRVGFACLKSGSFPRLRRCLDAPLHDVSMRSRCDIRAVSKIVRIIRRDGYGIVHTHTPRAAVIGRIAAGWTGVALVHHVHSPASSDTTRRWLNWLNGRVERMGVGGADQLITVSASLARHMQRAGFDAGRISIVPNGVPSIDFPARPAPSNSCWTLGVVALFRPRKGIEVLLDALAMLRAQGLPVRLRAIGPFETAQYEAQLKRKAAQGKHHADVCWTGFAQDVNAELARMDLLVLPSLFGEGMPMVVLEAMAAGVPVVATRVEGVPEAIRDGVDGVLAQPGDAEDLARAIARVVRGELDWSQLRDSAWRRQAEMFSDRSMAAGVAAAYRRAVGVGQKPRLS